MVLDSLDGRVARRLSAAGPPQIVQSTESRGQELRGDGAEVIHAAKVDSEVGGDWQMVHIGAELGAKRSHHIDPFRGDRLELIKVRAMFFPRHGEQTKIYSVKPTCLPVF